MEIKNGYLILKPGKKKFEEVVRFIRNNLSKVIVIRGYDLGESKIYVAKVDTSAGTMSFLPSDIEIIKRILGIKVISLMDIEIKDSRRQK